MELTKRLIMEHKEFITNFVQSVKDDLLEKSAGEKLTTENEQYLEKVAEELESLILVTGLDKEASGYDFATKAAPAAAQAAGGLMSAIREHAPSSFAKGLGMAGLGLATGLGALAVAKANRASQGSQNRRDYENALKQAISRSDMLADADQEKLRRFADSVFSFAPSVARDANVLTNVLTNAIHGESLDLQTIRAITELEEKLQKNNPSILNRSLGF